MPVTSFRASKAEELSSHGWVPHIVGKWHLGMASWALTPTYRGFETHFGLYNGATHYWAHTHPETDASSPLDLQWSSAPNTYVGAPHGPLHRGVAGFFFNVDVGSILMVIWHIPKTFDTSHRQEWHCNG